jgi:hypothetical protein
MECLYLENFFSGLPIKNYAPLPLEKITVSKKLIGLEHEILNRFIEKLKEQNIKLACFDFDMTVVDSVFTREFFCADNIILRLSPLFGKIADLLIDNKIEISMVTFNKNPEIQDAISSFIEYPVSVFAREDSRLHTGKGWHLDNAIRTFNKKNDITDKEGLRPSNVLFVDDDPINVEIATRAGYNCINNPNVISLDDLVKYIENNS